MGKAKAKREVLDDLVDHVLANGDCILFRRRGRKMAALVPIVNEKLLRRIEDEIDLLAAAKARKEKHKAIPLEKIRAKYGI